MGEAPLTAEDLQISELPVTGVLMNVMSILIVTVFPSMFVMSVLVNSDYRRRLATDQRTAFNKRIVSVGEFSSRVFWSFCEVGRKLIRKNRF